MSTIHSNDGTQIAFDQTGHGPPVILVGSALADRADTAKLAGLLAEHCTVVNYDRRGRGASGDTQPYAVEREIEDIAALIDAVGGSASVFGNSSGAVLGLDAASTLGAKIKRLALFEPPFILDHSRSPVPADLRTQVTELVAANQRGAAVKLFMSRAMGIPAIGILMMRCLPGWSKMKRMAHTLVYDLTLLEGLQAGMALPATRWAFVAAPTLVLTGEKSEVVFHNGARALAGVLPDAEHRILKGQHHGSVVIAPRAIAAGLLAFLSAERELMHVAPSDRSPEVI